MIGLKEKDRKPHEDQQKGYAKAISLVKELTAMSTLILEVLGLQPQSLHSILMGVV